MEHRGEKSAEKHFARERMGRVEREWASHADGQEGRGAKSRSSRAGRAGGQATGSSEGDWRRSRPSGGKGGNIWPKKGGVGGARWFALRGRTDVSGGGDGLGFSCPQLWNAHRGRIVGRGGSKRCRRGRGTAGGLEKPPALKTGLGFFFFVSLGRAGPKRVARAVALVVRGEAFGQKKEHRRAVHRIRKYFSLGVGVGLTARGDSKTTYLGVG